MEPLHRIPFSDSKKPEVPEPRQDTIKTIAQNPKEKDVDTAPTTNRAFTIRSPLTTTEKIERFIEKKQRDFSWKISPYLRKARLFQKYVNDAVAEKIKNLLGEEFSTRVGDYPEKMSSNIIWLKGQITKKVSDGIQKVTELYCQKMTKIPEQKLQEGEVDEFKIKKGPKIISDKLEKQFQYAQDQAEKEPDKSFSYLVAPLDFKGYAQTERIADLDVGVCHYIGRRPTMEDEHIATSFDLNVGGKVYPVQLFGIFDGHGGYEASSYVRDNLERKLHDTLNKFCENELTDEAIWNALKIAFVTLSEEFKEVHSESGTTATIAMILDGKLWTANVGDSRTILDNGIQLSEDAKPTDPRYEKGIRKRGGVVLKKRVNAILAVARAVGDHGIGAVSARPKITVYPLLKIPENSHLILTCDGIYDVSSTRQVAAAIRDNTKESAVELARNIVYSAYEAGSTDNLSALVVKL